MGAFYLNEGIDETIHRSGVFAALWIGVEEVNTFTDIRLILIHKNRKLRADVFVTNVEDNIALQNAVIGSVLKGNVSISGLFDARLVYDY